MCPAVSLNDSLLHEVRATIERTRDTYFMERNSQFCRKGKVINFNILETQGLVLGAVAEAMQINVPAKPTVNRTLCSMCLGNS